MSLQPQSSTYLHQLLPGQEAIVVAHHGSSQLNHRLMCLGILPGGAVKFMGTAPLGDPVDILVRGYRLSLRKVDASTIEVRPL